MNLCALSLLALAAFLGVSRAQEVTFTLSQTDLGVDVSVVGSITDVSAIAGSFLSRRELQSETRPVLRLGLQTQFIVQPFDSSGFNILNSNAQNVTVDNTGCENFPISSSTFKINATDPADPIPLIGIFRVIDGVLYAITVPSSLSDHTFDWSGTIFGETFASMRVLEGTTCSLEWTGTSGVPQKFALVAERIPTYPPTSNPTIAPPKPKGLFTLLGEFAVDSWNAIKKAFRRLAKALEYMKSLFGGGTN